MTHLRVLLGLLLSCLCDAISDGRTSWDFADHPMGSECQDFVEAFEDDLCGEEKQLVTPELRAKHVKMLKQHAFDLFGKESPTLEDEIVKMLDRFKFGLMGQRQDCGAPEICEMLLSHFDDEDPSVDLADEEEEYIEDDSEL